MCIASRRAPLAKTLAMLLLINGDNGTVAESRAGCDSNGIEAETARMKTYCTPRYSSCPQSLRR
jgi:hypothetical protein